MTAITAEAMATDRQGEDAGFDDVFRRERPGLVRLGFLLTGSAATAEEVVQDAFVALHRSRARGEVIANPAAFLRVVVVRRGSTWRRRRRTESAKLALLGEPGPVGEPVLDETWDALGRLRPERRVALVLRYYADLDFSTIADILGIPAATARTRVHRGLADLREELGDGR